MATLLRMPGVSADSDEAVLESWSIQTGATVSRGQVVASAETEKAVVDIEADQDGVVHTLLVSGGATVPVGDPIAILIGTDESRSAGDSLLAELGGGSPDGGASLAGAPAVSGGESASAKGGNAALEAALEAAPEEAADPDHSANDSVAQVAPELAPSTISSQSPPASTASTNGASNTAIRSNYGGRIFASPIARRMAKEMGVDIDSVTATGPGGRIVRSDVEKAAAEAKEPTAATPPAEAVPAAAAAPASEPAAGTPVPARTVASKALPDGWTETPHTRLRRLVASRLQESKQTVPHFYLRASLKVDTLLELRKQLNQTASQRFSINDFFIKAAARALVDVPEMNVVWTEDATRHAPSADIAVAVASDRGLVTPVIRNIESISLSALSGKIKDAIDRANNGKLAQSELEGGTLTISNLGMFGVEEFDAIINPPHAGILAVGAATRSPVVGDNDSIEVATVVSVVLSVDHRPVDGAIGARWLARFRELVESPMNILV